MPKSAQEIARETGFSVTTVRLVIYGQSEKYRISARTRQTIEDHIATHGVSVNHAARSLKLNRSETIGFVVPDLANAFFARIIAELEILCQKRNLLLLTVASHEDPERESRAIASLLARGVDGLVLAPCQPTTPAQLRKRRVPIVLFDRNYGSTHYPTVLSDNFHGGVELTRKMLEVAAAPVHFLCGHAESPSIADRIRAFIAACADLGIVGGDSLIHRAARDSALAGRQMMRTLIDARGAAPQAFMCSSLLVLEGALQQIKTQTGKIDPAIVIGTFDDHAMLDLLPNRVLSVRQGEAALARRLFERLIEPAGGTLGAPDIVASELISRNL